MALLLAQATGAAGIFADWKRHGKVVVNTAPEGADLTSDVHAFPLLLRLHRGNFDFSEARGQGDDIRFSKPGGGVPLPHQIDRWDSAAGKAEIWIRLDTVKGASRDPSFEMHWGNPGAAGVSDGAAVFDTASGFAAAWHLGGAAARANAVAGGNPARPVRFDGDEVRNGVIGLADNLDGAAEGGYLDLGEGYSDFSRGFTFSVWARPAKPMRFAKFLDLGNGMGRDNISLFRVETSQDLAFNIYANTVGSSRVVAPAALDTARWRHYAVTVAGRMARLYRDGREVQADTLPFAIPTTKRTLNYLGRSNWSTNEYYQGLLDEATLAKEARSAAWICLAHATQAPGSAVVTLRRDAACLPRFSVPPDTEVVEGSTLELHARAECATHFAWTQLTGPRLRITDPVSWDLRVQLPRVTADTLITLSFRSEFPDGEREQTIKVRLRETIPDPICRLPDSLAWNGRDSLELRFAIPNLAAVRASPDSVVHRTWSLEGPAVDTVWTAEGLLLRRPQGTGTLRVGLCLQNGGAPHCDTTVVAVGPVAGIRSRGLRPSVNATGLWDAFGDARDIRGRKVPGGSGRPRTPRRP